MTDAAASGSEGVPSSEFAGVPDGFSRAAAELYRRAAGAGG